MNRFKKWLSIVKDYMVKSNIITKETILDNDSYKPYYDDNISPYNFLLLEFGKDWTKAHQKLYYKKLKEKQDLQNN